MCYYIHMNNCKQCIKEFLITIDRTTFCSHACQFAWARTLVKKKGRSKNGIDIVCKVCKKLFYVPKYRIMSAIYCSRSCGAKDLLPQYSEFRLKPLNKPLHKYKTTYVNGKQHRLHRYVMEQHLGRRLERWEHVHHINDDSYDNRLENLVVLSNSDHQKQEAILRKKLTSSSS